MTPAEINNKLKILNGNITRQTKIDDNFQKLMHHTNIDCMISNAIARLLINSKNNVGAACFLNNDTNVLFSSHFIIHKSSFNSLYNCEKDSLESLIIESFENNFRYHLFFGNTYH